MLLKKLTFIFSIMLVLALISGCARDNRPTRAYYHYEEFDEKDNDEKDNEEEQKDNSEKEDSAKLQDLADKMFSVGMSTVIDGQDPNALKKLEKMLIPDLDD